MKKREKFCQHYWNYDHTTYSGPRGATLVRRWCDDCKTIQVGSVRDWRLERDDEFDVAPWDVE